ncbi:MAG: 3-dehydroquinate synthase [Patiriisocius sp.]|jgi:3-dehydroquinate synthase
MNSFSIDNVDLHYPNFTNLEDFSYNISSHPKDYNLKGFVGIMYVISLLHMHKDACLVIDKNVYEGYFKNNIVVSSSRVFLVNACEEVKSIDTVLEICKFFAENNINRASNIFVIGGGSLQDLGGTASYLYKRGVPWTYIPTTLLGISDSCLGGKTAVNFHSYKNLLGLFSAPKEVILCVDFLDTLSNDQLSCGYGEIYRLALTGGVRSFQILESNLKLAISGDLNAIKALIISSLLVKKAVIEEDEYEVNIRKSMNYGHTVGHALEGLSDFKIPHGIGVCIGILVENKLALKLGLMSEALFIKFLRPAKLILRQSYIDIINDISFDEIGEHLRKDKKTVGNDFNFSYIKSIGEMHFSFNDIDETKGLIIDAKNEILTELLDE